MKNPTEVTTLFVNPIPGRVSGQGRHKQMFTVQTNTGESIPVAGMNKFKEFGTGHTYDFQYNATTNKLNTGLDKLIPNPYKGLEPIEIIENYGLNQDVWLKNLEAIVKQEQIKLQTHYEIMDNVSYNYYTNEMAGNQTFLNSTNIKDKDIAMPNFLQRFSIVLYDQPNRFTDETTRGRLAIALIKNHTKIAKNRNLLNSALHEWYISEENEAVMEKMKKREIVEKALFDWYKLKTEAIPYRVNQVASLLTNKDNQPILKGRMSDIKVKESVSDYLGESSSQMDNIVKFTKVNDLASTKEGLKRLTVMYLIQQAINTNVIGVRDGFYIWHSKSGTPNMHKHQDLDKFINLLLQEYSTYNPKDTDLSVTNWYRDLLNEVKDKGAWIE